MLKFVILVVVSVVCIAAYIGFKQKGLSVGEFLKEEIEVDPWRNPRRGESHAENMTNDRWVWTVKNNEDAYGANEHFGGPSSMDVGPCWSFVRFGQSKTELPDGRTIYVAGEHEDHYDPDFYIYNDVIVVDKEGEVSIYGYPEKDFPATDFHSATLVGDEIILIGSLGYHGARQYDHTPVYKLNLNDFSIQKVKTTNQPGWIYEHNAEFDSDRNVISVSGGKRWTKNEELIDNFKAWELDLFDSSWKLVGDKKWAQYRLSRADGEGSNIWEIKTAFQMEASGVDLSSVDFGDTLDGEANDMMREIMKEEEDNRKATLQRVDKSLLDALYRPSIPHVMLPEPEPFEDDDDSWADIRIQVGDTVVRFREGGSGVMMTVEGVLSTADLEVLKTETAQKLSEIEDAEYKIEQIQ